MSNALQASEVVIADRVVDGRQYWEARARGWSTGPCASPSAAMERLTAYFAGESITTAPDGMASREEMAAAAALFEGRRRIRGWMYATQPGEFLGDDWIRASEQIASMLLYEEPEFRAATAASPRIKIGG